MHQKRNYALLLAVAAVAVGIWTLLPAGREELGAPGASAGQAVGTDTPVVSSPEDLPPVSDAISVSVASPDGARAAAPVEPPATSGEKVWIVRVLEDGAPAADVEVAYATKKQVQALHVTVDNRSLDYTDRVQSVGTRGRTNADGELWIPALPVSSGICAFKGPLWASRIVREGDVPPFTLELRLDRSLIVKLVDEQGAPVSKLDVELALPTGHRLQQRPGADGLASFLHVGSSGDNPPRLESGLCKVAVDGTFREPIEREFEVAQWPTGPLDLVVPGHGSVEVELVFSGVGRDPASTMPVELDVHRAQAPGARVHSGHRHSVSPKKDRALFTPVGLGLELEAHFDCRSSAAPASKVFRGPTVAGEIAKVQLEVETAAHALTFRAVDDQGNPLANKWLEHAVRPAGHQALDGLRGWSGSCTTDLLGQARVPAPELARFQGPLVLHLRCDSKTNAPRAALHTLPTFVAPGVTDLGDIAVLPPAVLVSGRVVDGSGNPIYAARVLLLEPTSDPATPGAGLHSRTGQEKERWSETNGTFLFEDQPTAKGTQLRAEAAQYLPSSPVAFVPGTRDLEIVLRRGAELAGSVVVPSGVSAKIFMPEFHSEAARRLWRPPLSENGEFLTSGLVPGVFNFRLNLHGFDQPIFEVAGLRAVDELVTRDPRIQAIEVASKIGMVKVSVLLPDGKPAEGGWVRVLGSKQSGPASAFGAAVILVAGAAVAWGPSGPLDLEVNVPGFRVERRHGVTGELEVRLQSCPRIRLELKRDTQLPPDAMSLQVRLQPLREGQETSLVTLQLFKGDQQAGWWSPSFGDEQNTFGAAREVFVEVQEFGPHAVEFHLVVAQQGGSRSQRLEAGERTQVLELGASDDGKTFQVAPDPAAYEKALMQ